MSLRDLIDELENLSVRKNNWYSVAGTFEKYKEAAAHTTHQQRRIKEGCEASSLSLNTLNRMIAARKFVDSVKGEVKELKDIDLGTLSFPSIEVVKRLYRVNPREGINMLSEVAKGHITYRDLREHYNIKVSEDASNASVQQVLKRETVAFEDAALDAIRDAVDKLVDGDFRVSIDKARTLRFPFTIDAIARDLDSKTDKCPFGFELFYLRPHENLKNRFDSFLERLLLNSCFFKAVWVVFPSTLGNDRVKVFSRILDLLDRRSIGLAVLPWGNDKKGSLKIFRKPSGLPTPDWSNKLADFRELHSRLVQPDRVGQP